MLTGQRHPLAIALLGPVMLRALRRRFRCGLAWGMDVLANLPRDSAVLCVANHTNWWDGFAVYALSRRVPHRRVHLMQEQRHLDRYPFFRYCGAFGIDLQGSPLPGLRTAIKLLEDPSSLVWVFPQGRLEHPSTPIEAREGAAFLSRRATVPVLTVHLAYEWLDESRPTLCIQLGTLLPPGSDADSIRSALAAAQSLHTDRFARQPSLALAASGSIELWRPRWSLQNLWDALNLSRGKRR